MDVFALRHRVISEEYAHYVAGFVEIRDSKIRELVDDAFRRGALWPDALLQLNPAFEFGASIDALIANGTLHEGCRAIFRRKPAPQLDDGPIALYQHQVEGILAAREGRNYVLTTGTGSGKSLSYIVPIVDQVLRNGPGRGVQAIIVYPMNALANSQEKELEKFLRHGFASPPVNVRVYTGQQERAEKDDVRTQRPDILLTNYVMLELMLTRPEEAPLIESARDLRFLVLDELHTYRGRQGADVAMLVRRVRERCGQQHLRVIGTSATLAADGTWEDQQREVARVASQIFGATVAPRDVIGETLRPVTGGDEDPTPETLRVCVDRGSVPEDVEAFCGYPLAAWVERRIGLDPPRAGETRRRRATPKPLVSRTATNPTAGLVGMLSAETGLDPVRCKEMLSCTLARGTMLQLPNGRPVFALRLHQFVARGEAVYASPEPSGQRALSLQKQVFVPGSDRSRTLLPLAFCRECGQEYYVVRKVTEQARTSLIPREVDERDPSDQASDGYLYLSTENPWRDDPGSLEESLPEAWIEERRGKTVVRREHADKLPVRVLIASDGSLGAGHPAHFFPAPFRFCLQCGVEYGTNTKDFSKLATLGSEGRSTATTILTLSTLRALARDPDVPPRMRKILSFTDNRQDASLQAGHFNDFVEVTMVRTALARSLRDHPEGLDYNTLVPVVFEAMALPFDAYAAAPDAGYTAREDTERAMRLALEYRLYRDLKHAWRLTAPNLEQTGHLRIEYGDLAVVCRDRDAWLSCHHALADASPECREKVCALVLDALRRTLCVRVDALTRDRQDTYVNATQAHLNEAWRLEDYWKLEQGSIALARGREKKEARGKQFVHLTSRGLIGRVLRRKDYLGATSPAMKPDDVQQVITDIFKVLAGPVKILNSVQLGKAPSDDKGYQIAASKMRWLPGDGTARHDPTRVLRLSSEGPRVNPYFRGLYDSDVRDFATFEAREHTAQVPNDLRKERERRFTEASLAVMFCSPTMELGVDIAELNVVNLRNVPPTPANYAQRSGRAGRSGRPALVTTYCAAGSPHDRYFFRRPERMVAGAVRPPAIDLQNEDLLRAHVHAIWFGVSRMSLHASLKDLLDTNVERPTLEVRAEKRAELTDPALQDRAFEAARRAMADELRVFAGDETRADAWLRAALAGLFERFDRACDRWRTIYRTAHEQSERQSVIARDASRTADQRDAARKARDEADRQLSQLIGDNERELGDFYSYRYFASEGFLPGYNFPRLPVAAWIPGQRVRGREGEYLSRARFLAISEFAPRGFIYHEGARFQIHKTRLPADLRGERPHRTIRRCELCGYLHHDPSRAPDRCEHCDAPLGEPWRSLFPMETVIAKRRDRITSSEEERIRMGYDIRTALRFAERQPGVASARVATLTDDDGATLASLEYGHAATLWRINLGMRAAARDAPKGFRLNFDTGEWDPNAQDDDDDEASDPSLRKPSNSHYVLPYVEDHRNCLLVTPVAPPGMRTDRWMASLQACLKAAIQTVFQLEDNELAAESLPDHSDRRRLLFFESAEGGAGVLRQLVEDPTALARIATEGLRRCHYDPDRDLDLRRAPNADEDCDAACYDCLLSYYNQTDHRLLDRTLLRETLSRWSRARTRAEASAPARDDVLAALLTRTQSELERTWLRWIASRGYRLPDVAQYPVASVPTTLDFYYRDANAAVFIDGGVHDTEGARRRDAEVELALSDRGATVLRFHHAGRPTQWEETVLRFPSIFGEAPAP